MVLQIIFLMLETSFIIRIEQKKNEEVISNN